MGIVPLFYVDAEENVPTYFSVLLILFAALLLAVIAVLARKEQRSDAAQWIVLSVGFFMMAYDEAFRVHESLITPMREILGDGDLGVLYFAWVIPGIAVVLAIGLYLSRFILRLESSTRMMFVISACLYLGGAIGFELLGGAHAEVQGTRNWKFSAIVTVEESLEMAGLIVFIRALLDYLSANHHEVRFRFSG